MAGGYFTHYFTNYFNVGSNNPPSAPPSVASGGVGGGDGGGYVKRRTPEVESLLATQALVRTMWENGQLTREKREQMLASIRQQLKRHR